MVARPSPCHHDVIDTARIDVWLWAVRLTPNRSAATELCRAGRVLVNNVPAKAATAVRVGDRVEARIAQRQRVVEVVQVIQKRVGASVAATCLVDHSPPVVREEGVVNFQRERGSGRPTKKDRRQIDRLQRG